MKRNVLNISTIFTTKFQVDKTERTWNESFSGYDHNLVGVRVKTKGKIFKSETFEFRNLDPVTVEDFREAWEQGNPDDIFLERRDVSEALRIWEHKVHLENQETQCLQK